VSSRTWFTLLVLATGAVRLVELRVAARNLREALARGGLEYGRGHYPVMVVVHVGLLVSCIAEVWLADRPFLPWLGWPALAVLVSAHVLRWWCIRSLGWRWNTRVVVVPGLPPVRRGPYRWLDHPNYVAVAVEVAALPLVHTAWLTAAAFSLANVGVMALRIPVEERALASAAAATR
jgi:methyltransferase